MTKIIFHTMSNVTVNKTNKKQLNTLRRIAISLMHIPVHDNHNQQGYKAGCQYNPEPHTINFGKRQLHIHAIKTSNHGNN